MQTILLCLKTKTKQVNKASTFIKFCSGLLLFSCSEFSEKFLIRRYQEVMMSVESKLSWKFLIIFFAITSTKLLKGHFLLNNLEKKRIFISQVFLKMLFWNSEPPSTQTACQSSFSGNFWGCKIDYTSRWSQWIN